MLRAALVVGPAQIGRPSLGDALTAEVCGATLTGAVDEIVGVSTSSGVERVRGLIDVADMTDVGLNTRPIP